MEKANFHGAWLKLAWDPSISLSNLPRLCFFSCLWLKGVNEGHIVGQQGRGFEMIALNIG